MPEFITKDSGERAQFESGMQRDTEDGKPRFDLMMPLDIPYEEQMITRLAALYGRGAVKYEDRNWEKANSEAEMARMKSSAFRHFVQWLVGEVDEDHAAGAMFNIIAFETTKYKVESGPASTTCGHTQGPIPKLGGEVLACELEPHGPDVAHEGAGASWSDAPEGVDDEWGLEGGRPYKAVDVPAPEEPLHAPWGLGDRAEDLVDAEQPISEGVPLLPSVAVLQDMMNSAVFNRALAQATVAVGLVRPLPDPRTIADLIGPDLLHKRPPIDWSGRSGG